MAAKSRPTIVLVAWLLWTLWVAAHYFAVPLTRPAVADGIIGIALPYWREAAATAARSLVGAALTLGAAWGFGRVVLSRFSNPARGTGLFTASIERVLFELACGLALLSTACLALALLDSYRPALVRVLLLLGVVTAIGCFIRAGRRVWIRHGGAVQPLEAPASAAPLPRGPVRSVFVFCGCLSLAFAFIGALAPEIEYDALWYHLWLPQQWLEAAHPVDIVHEYVSLYPLFWELIYGSAMVIGGPGAAKLLHFACLPLVGLTTALLARSTFPRAHPTLAAALAIGTPLTMWEGSTAYNDLALAWYATLAIYALLRHHETRDSRWFVLAGATIGSAMAIKHLAILMLVSVVAILVIRELVTGVDRRTIRAMLLGGTIALALPAPWYARAYVAAGNPFFPEMYGVFGARPADRWSPETQRALDRFKSQYGPPRTVAGLASLPWDVTVHGARYAGTFGPLFLMLVPWAFVGGRLSASGWLLFIGSVLYVALWASPFSSFQIRFLIPIVPVLAVFAAAGVSVLSGGSSRTGVGGRGILVAAVVTTFLVVNLPPFIRWHERDRHGDEGWLVHTLRMLPGRVVLGGLSADDYLGQAVPSFRAWTFINRTLPAGSRVLTFSGGDNLYSNRSRIWSDAAAAHYLTWGTPAGQEDTALREARRLGVTHVLFDKKQLASGAVTTLAIGSAAMRSCCLVLLDEDVRFALWRIDDPRAESVTAQPSGTGIAASAPDAP